MEEPEPVREEQHEKAASGHEPATQATDSWGRQMLGAVVGGLLALVAASLARGAGLISGSLVQYVLWGGVVGGLIGGADALALAGKRLTRKDARGLNILAALLGMAFLFGAFLLLVRGVSWLVRLLFGRWF